MRVVRGGLSIFVSVSLFVMVMTAPVWPHDFSRGARIRGPVIFAEGVAGAQMWHRGYPLYPWGYYPLLPPSQSPFPPPSPYDFETKPAGRLRVSVQPQSAEVFVDGMRLEPVGNSAFDLGLLVGSHSVQITKEGYRTYTSEVLIDTAKTTLLSVELKRR